MYSRLIEESIKKLVSNNIFTSVLWKKLFSAWEFEFYLEVNELVIIFLIYPRVTK